MGLDEASLVPWVLLSGGVDDETFERQVACRLPGRGERRAGRQVGLGRGGQARPSWSVKHSWTRRDADAWRARRPRRRPGDAMAGRAGSPPAAGAARPRLVRAVLSVPAPGTSSQRDIDLLVVGEINPDVVVSDPDPTPVFGQAERFVEAIRLSIGSSSAITACGAARLGLRVAMVGVVGDDALGRYMLEALADRGVNVAACRVDAGRPTGASVILGNGEDRAILTATGTIARRAGIRRAGLPARTGAPPPRRQLLPPAVTRSRAAGPVPGSTIGRADDQPRPQLGSVRWLGRRVRGGGRRG